MNILQGHVFLWIYYILKTNGRVVLSAMFYFPSRVTILYFLSLYCHVNVRDNDINVQWQIAKEDITEAVEKAHLLEGHYSAL